MAKIIEQAQLPTLVISHNKTLAAQLYREFKDFFPENAVEYFVSYYDYYQPEAYVPGKDLYIEKDSSINEEIDRLRLAATASLLERRDVIVVATVSCIYGIGNPRDYREMRLELTVGQRLDPEDARRRLVRLLYERNDAVLERAHFRVRGDVLEIFPSYTTDAVRVEFFGDQIERIRKIHPLTGESLGETDFYLIYPAKHFVTPEERLPDALERIRTELASRHQELLGAGKLVEAERLKSRTEYDLEMLQEMGYCPGIENYSTSPGREEESPRCSGLLPGALPDVRRRVPRHPAPGAGHVRGGPRPQVEPGALRLPPALGAGQPAAVLRRVREPDQQGGVRFRHSQPGGDREERAAGGADHPAHRPAGPPAGGPAHRRADRRPVRRDP
jgi:excinuclease ABC subunit B